MKSEVRTQMSDVDGWEESATPWIAELGDDGDFGRRFILDGPMLARIEAGRFTRALDVGCGEGRFCRMLQSRGIPTVGIDPTGALIRRARSLDGSGDYRLGRAEALDFPDASFDLVISYLTLVDIPDVAAAIAEMTRVLQPGGALLIANCTSYNTAAVNGGWTIDHDGEPRFAIDDYLTERAEWVEWRGIRIRNWHRPLRTYMALLLSAGLQLRFFDEPEPHGSDEEKAARYRRVPYFLIMEWEKPAI